MVTDDNAITALIAHLDRARAGRLDVVADDEVVVEIRSARADARARRHSPALNTDAAALAEDLFPVLRRGIDTTGLRLLDEEPRLDW